MSSFTERNMSKLKKCVTLIGGILLLLVGLVFNQEAHGLILLNDGINVCNETYIVTRTEVRPVQTLVWETYETCCSHFIVCWDHCDKQRQVLRTVARNVIVHEDKVRYLCCPGYTQVARECTQPICSNGCGNGTCSSPEVCNCAGTGFTGPTCSQDIDECLVGNGGCEHSCRNTFGGYECSCSAGLILDSNGKTCSDVDECAGNHQCQQLCNNYQGSYFCSCNQGYGLQADTRNCALTDICLASNPCEQGCNLVSGTVNKYECSCKRGLTLTADNHTCGALPTNPPTTDPPTTPLPVSPLPYTGQPGNPGGLGKSDDDDNLAYYVGIPIIILVTLIMMSCCCLIVVALRRRKRKRLREEPEYPTTGVTNPVYVTDDGGAWPPKMQPPAYDYIDDEERGAAGYTKDDIPFATKKSAKEGCDLEYDKQENIYVRHPGPPAPLPAQGFSAFDKEEDTSRLKETVVYSPDKGAFVVSKSEPPAPAPKPRPEDPYAEIPAFKN